MPWIGGEGNAPSGRQKRPVLRASSDSSGAQSAPLPAPSTQPASCCCNSFPSLIGLRRGAVQNTGAETSRGDRWLVMRVLCGKCSLKFLGPQRMQRTALNLMPRAGCIVKDRDFINISALARGHMVWGIRRQIRWRGRVSAVPGLSWGCRGVHGRCGGWTEWVCLSPVAATELKAGAWGSCLR